MKCSQKIDFGYGVFQPKFKRAVIIARWLMLVTLSLVFHGPVSAAGDTSGLSPLSKKLYVAVMNQPNEIWMENSEFIDAVRKSDMTDATIESLKETFSLHFAQEQMTIDKARKVVPELTGMDDAAAFRLLWHVYYPTADKEVAEKILNYTPDTSFHFSMPTSKFNRVLLLDAFATALAPVLFFWSIAYFILVRPKKIRLSWQVVLMHIGVVEIAVALVGTMRNDLMISGAALFLAIASTLILRLRSSGEQPTGSQRKSDRVTLGK
jgi:hypothetical protein